MSADNDDDKIVPAPEMVPIDTETGSWDPPSADSLRCASGGLHRNQEAKARCWGCSRPELLQSTPDDEAVARQLYEAGYFSTSNRYRHVARIDVPRFEDAVALSVDVPDWLVRKLRTWWIEGKGGKGYRGHWFLSGSERCDEKELTPGQFFAFKRLQNGR